MIGMLLDHPAFDPADLASLEVLLFGGSPISDTVLGRMRTALPRTRLIQGFGQTETMATGSMLPADGAAPDDADPPRQSAGRAASRSEERRVGKEWVRTGRSRWWP